MKTRFLVFVPLVCLSLCAMIALPLWMGQGGEQVEITQTTLEGDPSCAQGLNVTCRTVWEDHLFWETSFSAQNSAGARTELTTYQNRQGRGTVTRQLILEPESCNFGISTSEDTRTGLLESTRAPWGEEPFLDPAAELASEMEPGTTRTFPVKLAEWYDYWPMIFVQSSYSIDWTQENMEASEVNRQFQSFFSIPVPQDLVLYYTLCMNENGAVYDITINTQPPQQEMQEGEAWTEAASSVQAESGSQPPSLRSCSVRGEKGWYLVLDNRTTEIGQQRTDLSHIRGGNGVIFLPAERWSDGTDVLRLTQIQVVYPFPEGESAVSIDRDQAGRLLVYTADEEENWYLTVLDEGSAQVLQRLELGRLGAQESVWAFVQGEGIRLIQVEDQTLLLLVEEGGEYRLESTLTLPKSMIYRLNSWPEGTAAAWDGTRLAVVCSQFDAYQTQMLVAVWQEGELSYLGTYQNSLGRTTTLSNNYRAVQMDEKDPPFQLNWS